MLYDAIYMNILEKAKSIRTEIRSVRGQGAGGEADHEVAWGRFLGRWNYSLSVMVMVTQLHVFVKFAEIYKKG